MNKRILDDHDAWMRDDAAYRDAYEALGPEFAVAEALISARVAAGMTQADVAAALGVKQPAVARIESGGNVSLKTLEKYARVLKRRIKIDLVPA
ncbi:helix-turn-helix transcriptional regulator [Desulfolutivibrio sulfoxidireducens]|uniref:helix-turn-helix transcriptional regulator n=1 Tax=Desulfolutivibrio sulfoxidireducens TaxID=2773299 RepID=UPI001FEB24A1|nr:helix-turn-helix transcriptional regulator [Desulfolutivibrio sulfoxidireducens]